MEILRELAAHPVQATATAALTYGLFVLGRFIIRKQRCDFLIWCPQNSISVILGRVWPPRGWSGHHDAQFIPFYRAGVTAMHLIWPLGGTRYLDLAEAAALKQVFNDRHKFVKDVEAYERIMPFGKNIIGTEGHDWVRHRSITRKAFGERNNALLWVETVSTLDEWFSEWDSKLKLNHASSTLTVNFGTELRAMTLFVIANAGFGLHFTRDISRTHSGKLTSMPLGTVLPNSGYTLPFGESLFVAIETMIMRMITPNWAYKLNIEALNRCDEAHVQLGRYIGEMIEKARRGENADVNAGGEKDEAADLFRRLIEANDEEAETGRLTDGELASNIFAFFLAGHETTANTLTFAFALLALYPEVQDRLFDEVNSLWPDTRSAQWTSSSHVDSTRLEYALAVFRETLRLFPAVMRVMRTATEDAVLPYQSRDPHTGVWTHGQTVVRRGVPIILNIHAVHMNPLHWGEDVKSFRPERFIDTETYQWPRDAWIPFTAGPHVCLGQRFAALQSVCILARVVRKYRISLTPEVAQLLKEKQRELMTAWTFGGTTLTPEKVELVLESRSK